MAPILTEAEQSQMQVEDEAEVQNYVENHGFEVEKIPRLRGCRTPDFIIKKGGKFVLVVEVKTNFSSGQATDEGNTSHASVLDPVTTARGAYDFDPDQKLKALLENSADQFREYKDKEPTVKNVPCIVAIVDRSAHLHLPGSLRPHADSSYDCFGIGEISGVLYIKKGQWEICKNSKADYPISNELRWQLTGNRSFLFLLSPFFLFYRLFKFFKIKNFTSNW